VAAAVGATLALILSPGPAGPPGTSGHAPPTLSAAGSTPPATTPAGSRPATTPAASPTASLIAVTVCTFPADGCTVPGAAQYMEVRPSQITDSGDGSGYLKDLTWSDWGSPQAVATGLQEVNTCTPNCAQGTYASYPATVTLAGLTPYGTGLEAYSTIVIQSPDAGTTETYTTSTVP
jgi:hypothetical protein